MNGSMASVDIEGVKRGSVIGRATLIVVACSLLAGCSDRPREATEWGQFNVYYGLSTGEKDAYGCHKVDSFYLGKQSACQHSTQSRRRNSAATTCATIAPPATP